MGHVIRFLSDTIDRIEVCFPIKMHKGSPFYTVQMPARIIQVHIPIEFTQLQSAFKSKCNLYSSTSHTLLQYFHCNPIHIFLHQLLKLKRHKIILFVLSRPPSICLSSFGRDINGKQIKKFTQVLVNEKINAKRIT